jgi:NADPH2:quinone reductase
MAHAVRFHKTGGPEVLTWDHIELPAPGPGEVRVRHTAIGVNFIDTYYRTGLYAAPGGLPMIPGNEGAGVITALGPGVTEFSVGERVAYGSGTGSYTTERNVPVGRLVQLPDRIDDRAAAAMMLKGMTAQYLLRQTFRVEKGHTVLIHAAAGGVGQIATQWAVHLGATVIATVGSPEKAEIARRNGCHHVILYREENFVDRVNEITAGARCHVVYDGVGKATFPGSLDCLRPRGMFVSFGNASGAIEAFNILALVKASLYCTRPTTAHYAATAEDTRRMAGEVFDVVLSGAVKIPVSQSYPLREAARAHADLEARRTVGSTILLP